MGGQAVDRRVPQAITLDRRSEHSSAGGLEGTVMLAHVNKAADDGVKLIDIENESCHTRIRVIVRQKAPFIQCKAMFITPIDIVTAHYVTLIVNAEYWGVRSAWKIDGGVAPIFQHEAMVEAGSVSIRPHDHAGIIDAWRRGASGAGETDRGKVPAAQAEPKAPRDAHDHAKVVDADCPRLRRSSRRGNRMKDTVVHHEAVLAGLQIIVLAHNLPDIIDVIRLRAFRAREVEVCELSLEQKKSTIVGVAGGECADNCALVIDSDRRTGNGSWNV